MTTILDDAAYRNALKRTVEAKWRMDAAQAAQDAANIRWERYREAVGRNLSYRRWD